MIIVAAPMFKQGCLKLLLSSCNFMVSIIDVYNILTRDCLWIPVMDVECPEMGIAQQGIWFVGVYIPICSGIYIWVMDNFR